MTTTSGSFPSSGAAQPHAPTQETQVGATTATTGYTYDADGDLTKTSGTNVTGLSSGGQDLSWDDAGRLASIQTSVGETDYVYDADGNLLIEKDPGQNTLFLPDEQIVLNVATGAVSGTRYYTIGGSGTSTSSGTTGNATSSEDNSSSSSTSGGTTASSAASSSSGTNSSRAASTGIGASGSSLGGSATVACRTSSGDVYDLIGDQQGTAGLAVKSSDLTVTSRYYDPYGNPVGPVPSSWPGGDKGFVGGTDSKATGLTNLGAREYQPQSGAFISPDSLINAYDPQDLNAYGYSKDSPSTNADPTGLCPNGSEELTGACDCAPGVSVKPGTSTGNGADAGDDGVTPTPENEVTPVDPAEQTPAQRYGAASWSSATWDLMQAYRDGDISGRTTLGLSNMPILDPDGSMIRVQTIMVMNATGSIPFDLKQKLTDAGVMIFRARNLAGANHMENGEAFIRDNPDFQISKFGGLLGKAWAYWQDKAACRDSCAEDGTEYIGRDDFSLKRTGTPGANRGFQSLEDGSVVDITAAEGREMQRDAQMEHPRLPLKASILDQMQDAGGSAWSAFGGSYTGDSEDQH